MTPAQRIAILEDELTAARDELARERELLREARDCLKHTRCIDDDSAKCEACSIESRIDAALEAK